MSLYFQTRKNSPTHIKRPMNAFMVFSHHERKKVIAEDPKIENTNISKELGRRWKNLSDEEREPYIQEADKLRQYHQREYPDYKYKPIKKKIRTKFPSEKNPGVQRPDGVMRSNSGSGVFSSGIRSNKISVSYGGPLRQLDPNRPKLTINNQFKSSLRRLDHKRRSCLPLEPPSQGAGAHSELSPPAKVPYSPRYPSTPDPQCQTFYADTRLEAVKANVLQSPHPRMVPISPMTRSCPVTPLSRNYHQHHPLTPETHSRSVTKPPSPLFSKNEQFSWDLDSASLPDLTSFLDNFLPSSSTEISLDVGDLKLDFTPEATEEMSQAPTSSSASMLPETRSETLGLTPIEAMETIDNIRPEDLFDDNLIDLKLMEFVN